MKMSARGAQFLVQSGRLVDGMLLDIYEVEAEDGRTLTILLFSYRIGGVDYECSQDITAMRDVVNAAEVRAGFPCTVRYQPGNPHNSIVVAEGWTGLREGLPQLPSYEDPDPVDMSHLRPGKGLRSSSCVGARSRTPVKLTICMFTRRSAGKGANRTTLVLRISLAATLAYVVVTFVAGLRAHSLALLSESGHNVSDFWPSCSALSRSTSSRGRPTTPELLAISAPA